jgi:GntR family transcriptional regulator of arabinose operon
MSTFVYMEIASTLRGRIAQGDFEQNRLPSERDLTAEFKVQRATVRRALKELEREGLVVRDVTRRGTFINRFPLSAANSNANRSVGEGSIALVIGRALDSTAPGDIARGLSQVANTENRSVIWFDLPAHTGHAEAEVPDPRDLIARGIAAAVVWPDVPVPVERLRALREAMPLVLLDRRAPGFESDFVGIDDFAGGRMVTEHLLGLGHRRIGFLSVASHASTVQARCRGWAAALNAAGITPRPEWILHRDNSKGELTTADDEALELLLRGGEQAGEAPLDAIVCANDTVAAGLIRYLFQSGRSVGSDVAVTGFGNTFPALLEAVGLTTVAQPFEGLGRTAAEILMARLQGEEIPFPSEVELPVELIVRRSCGAAGGKV